MKKIMPVALLCMLLGACVEKSNKVALRDVSIVQTIKPAVLKGDKYERPELIWAGSDGEKVSFKEITQGKVVLVVYWATWCIPCKMTLASLRAVRQKYDSDKVQLLGIATYESTEAAYRLDYVSKFVRERDFGYPVLLDDDGKSLWSAFALEAGGVPTMIFIGRDGVIQKSTTGTLSEEDIAKEIDKLLL